jgi:hypothetical protein
MAHARRLAGAGVICLYAITTPFLAATPNGKVFAKSGSPSVAALFQNFFGGGGQGNNAGTGGVTRSGPEGS